jgi:hypothetical protein
MRRLLSSMGVVLAAAALLGMSQGRAAKDQAVKEGDAAPEIKAAAWFNGKETNLAAEKGKVVLLEFWASW